ncbi:hypothetical protein Q4488_16580 [Amphritea sp. 1_MG-2023]|uniref:2-keto-4-pentenoate hydratase n=1 Tax=Amphritea sp. 1_MG-2023 TaxID=3062670 RepID=UPI0026E29C91|nr:hypothetical protein [Amphritea sp. 1_MG-2023]MDO6564999.1 hypothetical protein [Amphritea sp. 1_MG-2023]
MQQADIHRAAQALLARRLNHQLRGPLAANCRPHSVAEALAIQRHLIELMAQQGDPLAGWKCALPISMDGMTNVPVVAPIFSGSVVSHSPCPIILDDGHCKIEPEIAFCFAQDLPCRATAYSEDEVIAALGGAQLALELILSRYIEPKAVSYIDHLADCLFNQGLFLGPAIGLEEAFQAATIDFTLTAPWLDSGVQTFAGQHPCGLPQTPLLWLVNFLNQQGIGIKAGQQVITSSYAGVIEARVGHDFTLTYGSLGEIRLQFTLD